MRLGLISAAYPPNLDGIGDYTWWLARTLAKNDHVAKVVVFTRDGIDHTESPRVELSQFYDPTHPPSFSRLPAAVQEETNKAGAPMDWVVVQYNPFSWGRRGFCPWVPSTLRRLCQTKGHPKLAVMFHETTTPKWPWRFLPMYAYQYPCFKAVCRLADVAFVSTMRWAPQVRRAASRLPVHHLPVGSNIPLSDITKKEARLELGINQDALILGVFGGAHVSRRLDWIGTTIHELQATRPGQRIILLYVGAEGTAIREAMGKVDLIDCGALPAEKVGVRLRAMDAALSPFVDGISTRRGSAMALLQHAIPIATTHTSWTDDSFSDQTPTALLLSSSTSARDFAADVISWLRRLPSGGRTDASLFAFFGRHFTWKGIADTMLQHLC